MNIKDKIKQNKKLKKIILWMLMPNGQARPRLWVSWFVNPFFHKKGKGARICRRTRMDVLPFNRFSIGKKSTIEDFCTINNGVGVINIGNNTRIGIGSVLIGPVNIGDDVRLAQNVVVTALNHNYEDVTKPISEQGVNTEQIYIGDETWIGANAVILPGVFIGKHCVIAAGSIVTKNVPSNSIVAGNPARIIKQYNKSTEKWERLTK
ncbi:MAG: acyltransferase [Salinivirgaceae bacterium]|nr:acyltransferase [Salinivirgaceae bacterium]